MPLLVRPAPLWFAVTNSWVVAAERGGPAVIIDAPPDVEGVARLVAELDVVPVALLVTHGHVDHVGGSGGVADRFSVSAYLHPDDDWLASDPAEGDKKQPEEKPAEAAVSSAGDEQRQTEANHSLAWGESKSSRSDKGLQLGLSIEDETTTI